MSLYNKHPAVKKIADKYFDYSSAMYPYQFMDYYYNLPVTTPTGGKVHVLASSYISGDDGDGNRQKERGAWRRAVKKHFEAEGWDDADIKDWMTKELGRQGATFFGHGLPEEVSLVCQLALASGYKTTGTIDAWAEKWMGIDCNGFVNAYLTSLGKFSRPLHDHPSYINVSKPAKTTSEISYDSVIVTAQKVGADQIEKYEEKAGDDSLSDSKQRWFKQMAKADYKVRQNPGNGAHILVIDAWHEQGRSFWATDQAGKAHLGPECNIWHIMDEPVSKGNHKRDYVWRIRKHNRGNKNSEKLVFITREMGTR